MRSLAHKHKLLAQTERVNLFPTDRRIFLCNNLGQLDADQGAALLARYPGRAVVGLAGVLAARHSLCHPWSCQRTPALDKFREPGFLSPGVFDAELLPDPVPEGRPKLLRLPASTLSDLLHRLIRRLRDGQGIRGLQAMGIDEVSQRKGHKYGTLVCACLIHGGGHKIEMK